MKKIISIVLMLALCLGLFAGCADNNNTEPSTSNLANAKSLLFKQYNTAGKGEENKILADKDLTTVQTVDGISYPVEWTVEVTAGPADGVKITDSETANMVKLDIMDQPEEELHYTLTATIKDGAGNTETVTIKCYTPAVKKVELSDDTIILVCEGKYITGEDYLYTSSSGSQKHELVVSEDASAALKLTVRKNDDGTVTFVTADGKFLMADGTNVQIVDAENENTLFVLESAEGGQYIKCANATYNNNAQYLEVYSGYLTCYGMNAEKANIYTFTMETVADQSAILDAAYALGKDESLTGGPYTLTGVITKINTAWDDSYQNITVTIVCDGDTARPIQCFRMKGEGAKELAVGDTITVTGEIKNYSGTVEYDAGCTLNKVVKAEGGNTNEPEATEPTPTEPTPTEPVTSNGVVASPEAGKAYKFGMVQGMVGKDVYYLTGNMSSYYMETTTDASAAADVYLETTDGGYYMYCMVSGAKKYINFVSAVGSDGNTHINGKFEDTAVTVYTYDATSKTVVTAIEGENYWLGTRNDKTYTTMGPCAVKYEGFYGQFYGA